jgi:hypothetical protein
MEQEEKYLKGLMELEDLAEKKTRIYSRLLVEPALAKEMENMSKRHEERKERIQLLLYGKSKKKGGMSALKGEDKEE